MKVEYIDHMGTDLSVVNAARVSFAKESSFDDQGNLKENDTKLIKYLASHDHWTPFAHTSITLRMQAPIPVRTQCFKHKIGMVENEESRRYISTTPTFYTPTFRKVTENKKQGSGDAFPESHQEELASYFNERIQESISQYEELLDFGVCEEQARFLLPQACEVNWVWTGNLVSFANFVHKRTHPTAQVEIQELAQEVSKVIAPLFPESWKYLMS